MLLKTQLPPVRVVERICADVRTRGRDALFHYSEKLDGAALKAGSMAIGNSGAKPLATADGIWGG